jgi:putative component of toxin-antitoxin plasmid stabilization module
MEIRIYTDRQAIQPLIVWLEALKDLRAKAQIQARMGRVAKAATLNVPLSI